LADAREAAQQRRAKAALGQEIQTRKTTSEDTLRAFLTEQYEPWMKATHRGRADRWNASDGRSAYSGPL